MPLRQTHLSPLLRSLAALALVVYILAQSLCFAHCHLGGGPGDSTPSCCRDDKSAQACPGEGDSSSSPVSPSTATCSTLMNPLASDGVPALVVPEFFVLHLLTPHMLALDVTATAPEALFSRQANHRDWVLTPEVSLGPAFRSLAPPFIG
jgi:hypothetical protein